ncbi:MAG TPA: DUF5700 domain-containing putative Zn-dependent protease [Acidobacteriota bacterium]|nr:DUF5700 domain-containing putative Zn-dependent protease [Acidobacteriota bacterium]
MTRFVLIFCLVSVLHAVTGADLIHADQRSDATAIYLLLRLFDAIAESNPNYEDTLEEIAALDPQRQKERLAALTERNAHEPRITALIDSLLASSAYRLYFRQFTNVTRDVHYRVFTALPYRAVPSPADIGQVQLGLFRHRDSLAALVEKISMVSIAQPVSLAAKWAPPGDLPVPTTYYILDGNGDAFAKDGTICFDLYGVLLSKRPASGRYDHLAGIPTTEIEAVLAHEFQHVFAQPHLYPPTRKFDNWQDLWEDVIIRRIVSEGVALQCNPPSGFKRSMYEDSVVIGFWLRELERVIAHIRRNETTADSVRAWLDRSYQESARQLLADYLERTYPEGDQQMLLQEHIVDRPSGIYTLGWWMISHIVDATGGHDSAVQLLITPHDVFRSYNATVSDSLLKIAL